MTVRELDDFDDEISKAARALHQDWDSPALWPSIAAEMRPLEPRRLARWYALAAAAAVLITVSATWMTWRIVQQTVGSPSPGAEQRLLSDESLAEVERAERQYARAIADLTRLTAPKLEMPKSQLLLSLRERLMTIDEAIDEARMQIDINPFNAQLRQQLLFIYQEKRRTLEQIQEYDDNAL